MAKFDRETMWKAVAKLYPKAKKSDEVTDDQLAEALRKKFRKVADKDLADCTVCGESSPAEGWDFCPFCGSVEEVAEPDAKEEKKAKAEKPKAKEEKKPKAEKPKAKEEKKPKAKKENPKASIIPLVKDEAKRTKMRVSLDSVVKEIRVLQRDMLGEGYELGKRLIKVFDEELWKARGKYRSFKEWCRAEIHFTHMMARNYMRVAKEWERDQYLKLGVTKLAIISRLPPAERKPLVKAALEGADLKTIQKKVTEKREALKKPKGGRPTGDFVTTTVKLPRTKEADLPFFARDPGADGKPVKLDSYEPGSWAFFDLGNGQYMHLAIRESKGQFVGLRIQFSRKAVDAS